MLKIISMLNISYDMQWLILFKLNNKVYEVKLRGFSYLQFKIGRYAWTD